jgi:hypothetical protein
MVLDIITMTLESQEIHTGLSPENINSGIRDIIALAEARGMTGKAPDEPSGETGTLRIQTLAQGKPSPVQVKLFPRFSEVDGKARVIPDGYVDFQRLQTNLDGILTVTLPVRRFLVEFFKGPAFSKEIQIADIRPGHTVELTVDLGMLLDLRAKHIYSGDLHHHSIYSGPVYGGTDHVTDTVDDVYCSMLAVGLDFGALSDHHNIQNHREWTARGGEQFTPVRSKEISTSNGHVNAHGVPFDVIYRIPKQEERTKEYLRGEFIRVVEEIKNGGGLAQLNHPCSFEFSNAFPAEFMDIINIFETMEIWNGSIFILGGPNDLAQTLWFSLLDKGIYIPAVCGSDTHNIKADDVHAIIDQFHLLCGAASAMEPLPGDLLPIAAWLKTVRKSVIPLFEVLAEQCLGTADVRNCVHVDGAVTEQSILEALRRGHNTLTNGPLLFPAVNGKSAGETAAVRDNKVDVMIELYAQKPLDKLSVRSVKGVQEYPLSKKEEQGGLNNYSFRLPQMDVTNAGYLVFSVGNDMTNMAITNPVFLRYR